MKFSDLKADARAMIAPHKRALYIASGIIFLLEILFLNLSFRLDMANHEDAANYISYGADLLIYPIILANITMIARIYQGKSVTPKDSFSNYTSLRSFGKALWAYILPFIYLFLWLLPFIILTIVGAFGFVGILFQDAPDYQIGLGWVILGLVGLPAGILGFIITAVIKGLQYGLTPYILSDDPSISVFHSIKLSKQLMKGNKRKLFGLTLTFLGWFILIPFTLGLILIWIIPYYNATVYEFYNHIKSDKVKNSNDDSEVTQEEMLIEK